MMLITEKLIRQNVLTLWPAVCVLKSVFKTMIVRFKDRMILIRSNAFIEYLNNGFYHEPKHATLEEDPDTDVNPKTTMFLTKDFITTSNRRKNASRSRQKQNRK